MELDVEIGGIEYRVEVDVEEADEYVCGVFEVEVWDGEKYQKIKMDKKALSDFAAMYDDYLQEAYRDYRIAQAEYYAEQEWERATGR